MKNFKNTAKGITLIALIITIIILLIMAGVSLNALVGENGILTNSQNAAISTRFAGYKEATEMTLDESLISAGDDLKNYIPSITDSDLDKFAIVNGILYYVGNGEDEIEVANSLGIDTTISENATASDIVEIKNQVITLGETVNLPQDDTQGTPIELFGTRLYDKNALNGEKWNLIITYDSNNNETARYGSGYYYLTSENCESLGLTGNYLINYETKQLIGLNNYKNWNVSSTLAVTNGLVLNIDPTNVATGDWTGITKHGDITYDDSSKSLLFNEGKSNTTGEGGYLELTRSGLDFSNGFSFEIYVNLSRLRYNNRIGSSQAGFFCKISTLDDAVHHSMRFGFTNGGALCSFYNPSSWTGTGYNLKTVSSGGIMVLNSNNPGFTVNEDFYLTFIYRTYNSEIADEYYDDYMKKNNVDKLEYYINGELYGYTYYGHDSYINGLSYWNNDDCPFFVGVCPWDYPSNLYYLKGKVYTTRLYTCSMSADEVKENMDMTQKYRASF